jgi:NAD kinase
MRSALDRLIAGADHHRDALLLSGRVTRRGRVHATILALNDIVVTRGRAGADDRD